jgi:replicative DNA helicase
MAAPSTIFRSAAASLSLGEDIVNAAYDAPVGVSPRAQIEEAERRLYAIAETGRYEGGFQRFSEALTTAVDMAAKAYERDGRLSGLATGLTDLRRPNCERMRSHRSP